MRTARGFTLAEVLVALAVLAIGMSAALTAAGQVTRNAADMRIRTLAHWVAQGELTRQRLLPQRPSRGRQQGVVEMGGVRWRWELEIDEAPAGDMHRMTIMVADAETPDRIVVTETGFVGDPRRGPALSAWEGSLGVGGPDGGEEP